MSAVALMCRQHLSAQTPGHPPERNQELLQLHLKGQAHPAGVATRFQPLCSGTDSPATCSCW